jgi:signal transduction histidine kinase
VSGPASEVPDAAAVAVERLWLDRLYAIGRPVAHELRNALNGVSVNLEVVRSRARGDAPASSVARYADTAADQLESLADLTDALLALLRPVVEPADLGAVLQRVATLLGAVARPDGGAVEVAVVPDGATVRTAMPGEPLRALVASVLLDGFDRGARLCCELDGTATPTLRLRRSVGPPLPEISADVRTLAEQWGVRVEGGSAAWSFAFPPPAG